ncbi:DUF4832 domain-containing protein [Candidatus Hydrogenedentota bacterium]
MGFHCNQLRIWEFALISKGIGKTIRFGEKVVCAFLATAFFISADASAGEMVKMKPAVHDRHLRNPGMGQILYVREDTDSLPECVDVLYATLIWGDVEKSPGQYEFVSGQLKTALELAEKHDRMAAVRLVTSWQSTPYPIPKYLVDKGVKLFPKKPEVLQTFEGEFNEPEWWNPVYIEAYRKMVEAYGKALDGNPRIAFVDMRYYGFWGEGHRYGAEAPWPEDVDKREWCKDRIDEYMVAFKKTPLSVQCASDGKTPYPRGTAIDYAVEKGAWMRRDGFGNYVSEDESRFLKKHWKDSLMVAENAHSMETFLAGKAKRWWVENDKATTVEELFDEMLDHHTNYFPLGYGLDGYELVKRERPGLWEKAALKTGYRMVITEASWPKSASLKGSIEFKTTWRNTGVGRLPFPYKPALYLLEQSGKPVAAIKQATADLTKWYESDDHEVDFFILKPETGVKPGEYNVAAAIMNESGRPVVQLGIQGDDGHKRYVLGTIELK